MKAAEYPEILVTLSSKQLPVLSPRTPHLLVSLSDDSIDFPQLAIILERFPTIAARLIVLSNSAWSSPVSEISSLEMACARLGLNVVKSTSIALAVSAPFDLTHCPAFDVQRYWTRALSVAETTYQLARYTPNSVEIQTARTAGLLHNLGLLWITDQLPALAQQAIQEHCNDKTLSLDQALTDLIGVGYRQASGYLGEAWNLPSSLVMSMKHHGESGYRGEQWWMAQLVGLAISMVSSAEAQLPWSTPFPVLEELEIRPADANQVFSTVGPLLKRTRELTGTLFGN